MLPDRPARPILETREAVPLPVLRATAPVQNLPPTTETFEAGIFLRPRVVTAPRGAHNSLYPSSTLFTSNAAVLLRFASFTSFFNPTLPSRFLTWISLHPTRSCSFLISCQ
eukprot:13034705-Heterocapsa_arctica.AAC.1